MFRIDTNGIILKDHSVNRLGGMATRRSPPRAGGGHLGLAEGGGNTAPLGPSPLLAAGLHMSAYCFDRFMSSLWKLILGLMLVTVQRPFSHTRQVMPICTHLTHRPTYTRVCLAPNRIASRILNIGSVVFAGLTQTHRQTNTQTPLYHNMCTITNS